MRLLIINGPNLENIGIREPIFYGNIDFNQYLADLRLEFKGIELDYFQSHNESTIVEKIHQSSKSLSGIIINAGAYSHTSVAIRDAITATSIKTILVHISNVYAREPFRCSDIIAPVCSGIITGFGLKSYKLAVLSFLSE
jgi:3-dehydroquinate dehydratase-2